MTTCKDCIHYEVCGSLGMEVYRWGRKPTLQIFLDKFKAEHCTRFKPSFQFVELPCKIWDTLFVPTRNLVSEYKIVSFHVCGEGIWYRTNVIKGILTRLISDNVEIIGKTVFLTREEAEQALKLKERET